jgi:outer membrane lipoprotein-sorting protein
MVIAVALAGAVLPARGAQPPDLNKVMHMYDDLYRADSSTGVVEMTVVRPGKPTRTLRMRVWTQGLQKSLVRIESPAREAGTATLRVGDNMWNYLPRIDRTIRIPPSLMLGSWMGSDFTNDDLVRESSFEKDFTWKLVGHSTDPAGWTISLEAKPGVVGLWNRIELIVNDDGTLPVQAKYYDRKNRLARTMTFTDVKKMGGRLLPTRMALIPADKPKQRTEMHYISLEFNVKLPGGMFSLAQLEGK